jgi:aryl-alcohol dehydrogenase-like predicted oxidoreductase
MALSYRFLGNTGVRVSSLCLGTMAFGAEADEATSSALFGRARDAGINFFDCADVYAKGESERLLGKFSASCRDEVVISTKGYFPTSKDVNARGSSRYHLVRAVEASLRRLGTDYVDVYFLHRFDDATPLEETLRGLEQCVQQGKILYPAVSNFAAWQAARALGVAERHGWAPIVCTQPMYNLVKRQAESEILPMAQAEGMAVVSYGPLGGGLLSGKYGGGKRPKGARLSKNKMYRIRYGDDAYYQAAERYGVLAAELGHHPVSLAIAWVARHPAITAPLIGARNLEQLEPCLAAADVELDDDSYARVASLWPSPPPATDRNEETSAHNYGVR